MWIKNVGFARIVASIAGVVGERVWGSVGRVEFLRRAAPAGSESARDRPHSLSASSGVQRWCWSADTAAVAGGGGGRHGALLAAQAAVLARLPGPRVQPHGVAGPIAVE